MSRLRVLDVSKWQKEVDWSAVFGAGVGAAWCKATQGLDEVDEQFVRNRSLLRAQRRRRGWFHFPDARNRPEDEAQFFVKVCDRIDGEVQFLDVENDDSFPPAAGILNSSDTVGWVLRWCREVHRLTANRPLVYMSASRLTQFDWRLVVAGDFGLDVAAWGDHPPSSVHPWPFWAQWQDSNSGRYPGIKGRVDTDVFGGDGAVWDAYGRNDSGSQPHPATVVASDHDNPPAVPKTHVVAHGETLSSIATAFHVTVEQLIDWNEHTFPALAHNPMRLQPGWKLVVHSPQIGPKPPDHTVRPGDTLFGIAAQWGVTLDAVKRANPKLGPPGRQWDTIHPGDIVHHP
jgi:lysozyme